MAHGPRPTTGDRRRRRGGGGLDDDALAMVLADVATPLAAAGIAWALGGSASRRVRGLDVVPRDVDLVVAADARADLVRALHDGLAAADGVRPPAWRSAWLVRWRHPTGAMVEFIGGAAVVVGGREVALPPSASVVVDWRGIAVPVSAPDVWDRLAG